MVLYKNKAAPGHLGLYFIHIETCIISAPDCS